MKTLPLHPEALDDPLYVQKNPYQTLLLGMAVLSSWPLLWGRAGSGVIDRELTLAAVMLWGWVLLLGSLTALVGEFWRGRTWTGLVIERSGLAFVGVAALIYAVLVDDKADLHDADVAFVVGVTAAWGAACLWRCWQITKRLRWMRGIREQVRFSEQ